MSLKERTVLWTRRGGCGGRVKRRPATKDADYEEDEVVDD